MAMRQPDGENVTSYEELFEEYVKALEATTDMFRARLYAIRLASDPDFAEQVRQVEEREATGAGEAGLTRGEFAERYGLDAVSG